ncbi:hypothetical protein AtNW77_Chr3g0202671 [Arabidopsis thaliana]|uniref:Plant thionin family protein n=1 Tax=Arabidopsis thaliana x Arabidopsis arenosa TaxID=1240361 RepID=A0A8T2F7Z4_9BRAS|nr:hypothetical protein ISN45_At03g040500 [Arabidopsis thaliana x Arabidopsis arenosa]
MNMKNCIALMLVAVVITTMGGEVESVSCEIKCMLKCGGLLVPENTCIEPCMRAQCHKPPSPLSKSSTDDAIERRNMKEVEGLSCWDKCMFLCGLSLSSQKTCTDKCKKKCHISYVFPSQ